MATPIELDPVTRRVAEKTTDRDMESEDWQKAVAIMGLIAIGETRFIDEAKRLTDRAIETQTKAGQFSYGSLSPTDFIGHGEPYKSQVDPAAIGRPVLYFYDQTGNEQYLEAARRQYQYLRTMVQRTADGGIAHHRGTVELWVDAIFMVCPFMARYGQVAKEPEAFDEAVEQISVQAKHLQDPHTGLFRHEWRETPNSYPDSTFWSRGNGWALTGILDTLKVLPNDHHRREELLEIFHRTAEAVIDCQDTSGYWHNVLDDKQSPLEMSGTLMFIYAFEQATEMGLLDDPRYRDAAQKGFDVVRGAVDEEGNVPRVVGPPGGPGVPFAVTSYGQGWFLLATRAATTGFEKAL